MQIADRDAIIRALSATDRIDVVKSNPPPPSGAASVRDAYRTQSISGRSRMSVKIRFHSPSPKPRKVYRSTQIGCTLPLIFLLLNCAHAEIKTIFEFDASFF
jgi:hypothetical protein